MRKIYTEEEAAAKLHRSRAWLLGWLRANPTDPDGKQFFARLGRSRRFTADDLVRIFDLIMSQEEAGRPGHKESWLYYVDGGDAIKIGYSTSLDARMKKMSTDLPGGPKVLHVEPGTFKQEKIVHRHFAGIRVHGEWFRKTPELLQFIEERKRLAGKAAIEQ